MCDHLDYVCVNVWVTDAVILFHYINQDCAIQCKIGKMWRICVPSIDLPWYCCVCVCVH